MYKVTALSNNVRRLDLARWIYSLRWFRNDGRNLLQAMHCADDILNWTVHEWYLTAEEVAMGNALCTIEEIVDENPYVEHYREQEEYHALMLKGAAGDADAAIAYCKLEAEYKVSHAAMG